MGTHCRSPLILGLAEPLEQLALAHGPLRGIRLPTSGRRHAPLPSRRFVGIDESPTRRSFLPSARRRHRPALKRSEELLEILARDPPDLPDPDAAQHSFLDPGPNGLGRHLEPLCDLANGQELGLLSCTVRHQLQRQVWMFCLVRVLGML